MPETTSALFDEHLAIHGGDRIAAATHIARRLMHDDPDACKVGYTLENAVLAVTDLAALDDVERAVVRQELIHDRSPAEVRERAAEARERVVHDCQDRVAVVTVDGVKVAEFRVHGDLFDKGAAARAAIELVLELRRNFIALALEG